ANGKIWIATNNGVVTYENNIFTTIPQLIGKPVYTLEFVDTGIVWFSVHNEGIYIKNLNSWSVLSTVNGLSSNSPFVLKKGADSDVWIGHYTGFSSNSLDRYNQSNLSMTNYYLTNGLPDFYVRAIEKDLNGNIYIGTNNGLSRFNGTTFETLNYNGPLESNIIRSLFFMGSELWIGTFAGVSTNSTFLNLDDFKKVNEISIYPNPSNNLISIYKESNNTDNFLYKIIDISGRTLLNGSSKFMEQISVESLTKGNYIVQIEEINGEKWTQKLIKH
ncbi:T9SS type A sorting domain-containing protein, partial [Flavobacterium filum]|uniref:T9SS type A sorting domain-containing protein n=1 Tax=Flavobacterium filum TaxID=370974 RepID=UPI0023F2402B